MDTFFFTATQEQEHEFLNHDNFQKDAVRYNMFYELITRSHLTIKTSDNACIAIKNKENALWLWADETKPQKTEEILSGLTLYLRDEAIDSLSSAVAKAFALKYGSLTGRRHELRESLRAYCALTQPLPQSAPGYLVRPDTDQFFLLASYLVGIHKETFGVETNFHTQLKNAARFVKSGVLYGWQTDKSLVAMGLLTPYPEKFARLNYIYVSPAHRGRGYGKALTASLAAIAFQKGLLPVLYTNVDNLAANKLYTALRFADSGQIDEIRFL